MACINKYTWNRPKLRLWVAHTDSTPRTNVLPTPHCKESRIGEQGGTRRDGEDVINTRESAGNYPVVHITRNPLTIQSCEGNQGRGGRGLNSIPAFRG